MNKVITINLNGKAYQLEEAGYETLHAYLAEARVKLAGNPDQDEIVKDFEQAIAEKCGKYLTPHKNVITAEEIATIIKEMGPIDIEKDPSATSEKQASIPKRLYRIREGAWIAGVCNGIAAYFDIDVKVVRILFIIFCLFTRGGGIGLYILMAFFVPLAETNEERAFARGKQFNAHEFIEEMKTKYGKYTEEQYWKEYGDHQKRYWTNFANGWVSLTRVGSGIFGVIGSILLAALGIFYAICMWAIVINGSTFGNDLMVGVSPLLMALFISAVAYVVITPIRSLVREAQRHAWNIPERTHPSAKITRAILWCIALAFIIVIVVRSAPEANKHYMPYGTQFWIDHHHLCIGGNYYCAPQDTGLISQ